jgi:outer membrane protein TolC
VPLLLLASAIPALAGKDPADILEFTYEPPRITQESISLDDALRLTLENDPNVIIQEQSVVVQAGALEEAQGRFDTYLTGGLELSYEQKEIDPQGIEAEKTKRQTLRESIIDAADEADQLQAILNLIEGQDNLDDFLLLSDDPLAQEINNTMQLINALLASASPEDRDEVLQLREDFINEEIASLTRQIAELRKLQADDTERLRKLGAIPTISQDYFGELSLGLNKEYRTGLSLSPFFRLNASDSQYKGKPEDSSRGGSGAEGLYRAETGINFSYSIGRGGSRQVVTASEESAKVELSATRALLEHSSSSALFQTMLSYWNVVAAMQNLEVARQSLELQQTLVDLTGELVDGDELPRTELSQVEASASNSSAAVRSATRALHEARISLAQAMGLEVTREEEAPLASTGFPEPPDIERIRAIDHESVAEFAVMRRRDYEASRAFEKSGEIFFLAAHHDLRSTLDLSGFLAYSGVAEDSSLRGGVRGAIGQWTGPSTKLTFAYNKPLGNHTARGQLQQSEASLTQSRIRTGNLRRTIKANVIVSLGALEDAIEQINLSRESVAFYEESLESEGDKLRLGESTLINVIITEQRLTSARFSLVSSLQQYASLLTQLRFETATLIDGEGNEKQVTARDLLVPPFMN